MRLMCGEDVEILLIIQSKRQESIYGSPKLLAKFGVKNKIQESTCRKLEKEQVIIRVNILLAYLYPELQKMVYYNLLFYDVLTLPILSKYFIL